MPSFLIDYGKDAAAVANDAVRKVKKPALDFVLVDTVSLMQNREPVMRALSKQVEVSSPDRLLSWEKR